MEPRSTLRSNSAQRKNTRPSLVSKPQNPKKFKQVSKETIQKVCTKSFTNSLVETISKVTEENPEEIQKVFTFKNQNSYVRLLSLILNSYTPCEIDNDEEAVSLLNFLGCPYDSKKIFNPLGAPNTWPMAVLVLEWAVQVAQVYYIEPVEIKPEIRYTENMSEESYVDWKTEVKVDKWAKNWIVNFSENEGILEFSEKQNLLWAQG